jgi:hypothetical protein
MFRRLVAKPEVISAADWRKNAYRDGGAAVVTPPPQAYPTPLPVSVPDGAAPSIPDPIEPFSSLTSIVPEKPPYTVYPHAQFVEAAAIAAGIHMAQGGILDATDAGVSDDGHVVIFRISDINGNACSLAITMRRGSFGGSRRCL